MKRNYLIRDGFRERVVKLIAMPSVRLGLGVFVAAIVAFLCWIDNNNHANGEVFAEAAPLLMGLKFNKDGLSGENEKFINDLEKRIKLEPDSKSKDELLKLINDANKEMIETAQRLKALDADKVTALMEFLGTDEKGIRSILVKQGESLKKLQDRLEQKPQDMSVRAQVQRWKDENKDALEKLKITNTNRTASGVHELKPLEIRLNSPMTPSNTFTLGASEAYIPRPEFESGATEIVRPKLTFWDYITKGRTSSSVYVWVNKKNPEGAAGFIGPGVAKPGISLELASEISRAKKVAASDKVAIELLDDVEGFASYVEQELRFQVDKETNSKLMTGVESSTVIGGIQGESVPYSLVGVATDNPNNWDALVAAVAQLRAGNLDGAVTIFINPVDEANMKLTKAISQGQLFVPAMPDATIVVDNNVAVGYFQAAILANYNVKIYKDYTVSFGLENDDFTKNLVTAVGERRLHVYVKENHTGSFIYDTFANVRAAIAVA